jgi:hypothetical protein
VAEPTPGIPVTPRTEDGGLATGGVGVTGVVVGGLGEPPTAFIATTVNVIPVPLGNPVSVAVKTFPTVTGLPTEGVIVYPVIGEPPFDAGAVQETVAELTPATTVTFGGAPGTVAGGVGVTGVVVGGLGEPPAAFIAVTVNVTGVPLGNPVIVAVNTLPTVIGVPTDGVIVYPVMGEPPFESGAVQETVAELTPATTVTFLGAPGAIATALGVTENEGEEDGELPNEFTAFTVNVTAVPFDILNVAVKELPTFCELPTEGTTTYEVITEPPFEAGAAQETVTVPSPGMATTFVGASGVVVDAKG